MDDWLILAILGLIEGVLLVITVSKNQYLQSEMKKFDPNDIQKRLNLKEDYIKDLEREIDGYKNEIQEIEEERDSWLGKYKQKGQIRKLPGDKYDLTQTSDLGLVAEDVLNQIEKNLGGDVGQILSDPKIKKGILDYVNQNPEQAGELIKRFISNPGKKSPGQQSTSIPDFDMSKAI